jgi:hypothetical protein
MTFKTCRSCGRDLSRVPVKRKLFTQFMMKVVRCPHCRLRTTQVVARRVLVGGMPARRLKRDRF